MPRYLFFIVTLLLLGCLGCSDGLKAVSGKLVYDGKPVETAMIAFVADNGAGTTYAGTCTNGQYSIRVPEGEFQVRINASKSEKLETPIDTGVGTRITEKTVKLVPDDYGMRSRLKVTIDAKTQTHDFILEKPADGGVVSPFGMQQK